MPCCVRVRSGNKDGSSVFRQDASVDSETRRAFSHLHGMQWNPVKVFVTGVNGYIGAVLAPYSAEARHRSRWGWTPATTATAGSTATTDSRRAPPTHQQGPARRRPRRPRGCDAVAHLAELSNDPLGQNNPEVTHQINHQGSVELAETARGGRRQSVSSTRRRAASTAPGTGDFLDETSPTNPQTAYAECKVLVERDVGAMADDRLLPGLPAQRDRVRPVAAHALRHRAQRSVRARLDARSGSR